MNFEDYTFNRNELVVATAVNAYLKNLTPEAREDTLAGGVNGGTVNKEKLAALIKHAKAAAMISTEAWKDGEGDYQKALTFIRDTLPTVDSQKFADQMPEEFGRFLFSLASSD